MFAAFSEMVQESFVVAAGILKSISKDGHLGIIAAVVHLAGTITD